MGIKADVLYPIIYVRGYAMTRGEIDETTADPFCGFNIGSTVFRATVDRNRPRKYVFQSPVLRLASEFGYSDVFVDGVDIVDDGWEGKLNRKSIIIFRYYEEASSLLGTGTTPTIQHFAAELERLIFKVRDLVCSNPDNDLTEPTFRCYLVAHSMGGLVSRVLLQNPKVNSATKPARAYVDKFFTYATPHNGIDLGGINVPSWLTSMEISNFSRDTMRDYLGISTALYAATRRVDWIPESTFPSSKIFCLIGTNRSDYEVAKGLSRTFAGDGSDGLVKIENAQLCGVDSSEHPTNPAAKSYVYRSHSGYFGIVNSEESYQNLIRFLFGDIRVDIWLEITDLRVPPEVKAEADKGRSINALYQFELLASPKGKLWYLTRRVREEDSVACLTHQEWSQGKRSLYLSTVFLGDDWKVDTTQDYLAYSVTLGAHVPDYEIDRKLWANQHFEGTRLYGDSVIIELKHPIGPDAGWKVKYDWQNNNRGRPQRELVPVREDGKAVFNIDFKSKTTPGIDGRLRFIASTWNV
jgi:hypothetical protein